MSEEKYLFLKKTFGKSKINGEMLCVGPKGGIYKISDDEKKNMFKS